MKCKKDWNRHMHVETDENPSQLLRLDPCGVGFFCHWGDRSFFSANECITYGYNGVVLRPTDTEIKQVE